MKAQFESQPGYTLLDQDQINFHNGVSERLRFRVVGAEKRVHPGLSWLNPACWIYPRQSRMEPMTPHNAVARLNQLGTTLDAGDLSRVKQLYICEEETPPEYAEMIADMVPETVTLNGAVMTARDVPSLLHFASLQGLVAHRMSFADALLRHIAEFPDLRSIAMSHTRITDEDIAVLAQHSGLKTIHFAGTQLTDAAMQTFGTLPELELLDLHDTLVTDDGLIHLQRLTNLFTINVRRTAVTLNGADRYRTLVAHSLPDVEVLH